MTNLWLLIASVFFIRAMRESVFIHSSAFFISVQKGWTERVYLCNNKREHHMKIENIKAIICEIASNNPNGFTYNLVVNKFQKTGYAVATLQTQDCIGMKGLYKVIKFCIKHPGYCIGGWRNEDGQMQYDATEIFFDRNDALYEAINNKQRAIFNLYTGREILASEYTKHLVNAA
jgi:fructokinase